MVSPRARLPRLLHGRLAEPYAYPDSIKRHAKHQRPKRSVLSSGGSVRIIRGAA
jgi:hypothetical protein